MSKAEDRIIDRDVEFYEGEVDHCHGELMTCLPHHEAYWAERKALAKDAFAALKEYRRIIDRKRRSPR